TQRGEQPHRPGRGRRPEQTTTQDRTEADGGQDAQEDAVERATLVDCNQPSSWLWSGTGPSPPRPLGERVRDRAPDHPPGVAPHGHRGGAHVGLRLLVEAPAQTVRTPE